MSIVGNAITLGGKKGNPTAPMNDVIFIDYDGTILYSYTAAEFAALSALPPNPSHEGLSAQGWNWTLADAKTAVGEIGKLTIGQSYVTDDDKTRIYLDIPNNAVLTVPLYFWQENNLMRVDWGDGSSAENVSGSGVVSVTHTYSAAGEYCVTLTRTTNGSFKLGNNVNGDGLFGPYTAARQCQRNFVTAIELGQGHYSWQVSALQGLRKLKTITLPKRETSNIYGANNIFYECRSLNAIIFPENMYAFNTGSLEYCSALRHISMRLVDSNTFGAYSAYQCIILNRVEIFPGVKTINNYAFSDCQCISTVCIPSSVTSINAGAFSNMPLSEVRFTGTTPPTLSNANALGGLNTGGLLCVPFSALKAYVTGTNYPNPASYTYLGFATYQSGVLLPSQDTTSTYNVTWYATVSDAIAGTNAILTGNGKEIYCTYST